MWASFEMLDTFYGCMASLYHFVRDSLPAQSILYFITNENDNSPKVLLFLQVFILFPENCLFVFAISSKVLYSKALFQQPKAHHMCFDRFLLAFESRDLSQVDKSITRVSSFPSINF